MINEQYIARHGLKECLSAFRGAEDGSIDAKMFALKTEFYHLAQKMLYGGFLQVGDDYEIYIRTVEFYYHEEKESEKQIQDPIVYHRILRLFQVFFEKSEEKVFHSTHQGSLWISLRS